MKYRSITGISLLVCALTAYGEAAPRVGACASLESGTWSARGTVAFADCLELIQRQAGGDALAIGRWAGVLLAQDGVGVMTSYDQGKTWQAYRGQEPAAQMPPDPEPHSASAVQRQASTEPWPPAPAVLAADVAPAAPPVTGHAAADAPQSAAPAQPDAAAPAPALSLALDRSLSSTTRTATPTETVPIETVQAEVASGADTETSASDQAPESQEQGVVPEAPLSTRTGPPQEAPAITRAMTSTPEAGAAEPLPPQEPSEQARRDPDECRIRVTTGWVRSSATTLKGCARLLDQSPENYDSQGYKYAYWRDALLVATKFEVFTFDEAAQWTRVLRRYRY